MSWVAGMVLGADGPWQRVCSHAATQRGPVARLYTQTAGRAVKACQVAPGPAHARLRLRGRSGAVGARGADGAGRGRAERLVRARCARLTRGSSDSRRGEACEARSMLGPRSSLAICSAAAGNASRKASGGLPSDQTPSDSHILRCEPYQPLRKPCSIVMKRAPKHRICGFPNSPSFQ